MVISTAVKVTFQSLGLLVPSGSCGFISSRAGLIRDLSISKQKSWLTQRGHIRKAAYGVASLAWNNLLFCPCKEKQLNAA